MNINLARCNQHIIQDLC